MCFSMCVCVCPSQVSNVDDLKAEIFRLDKEMIHEKAKVAALSAVGAECEAHGADLILSLHPHPSPGIVLFVCVEW